MPNQPLQISNLCLCLAEKHLCNSQLSPPAPQFNVIFCIWPSTEAFHFLFFLFLGQKLLIRAGKIQTACSVAISTGHVEWIKQPLFYKNMLLHLRLRPEQLSAFAICLCFSLYFWMDEFEQYMNWFGAGISLNWDSHPLLWFSDLSHFTFSVLFLLCRK